MIYKVWHVLQLHCDFYMLSQEAIAPHLLKLLQDSECLPPPLCAAEGLDEEAGGSCFQRGEISPHDVIDIKHLSIVATIHTYCQVP